MAHQISQYFDIYQMPNISSAYGWTSSFSVRKILIIEWKQNPLKTEDDRRRGSANRINGAHDDQMSAVGLTHSVVAGLWGGPLSLGALRRWDWQWSGGIAQIWSSGRAHSALGQRIEMEERTEEDSEAQ
jgi:hypothetical protein